MAVTVAHPLMRFLLVRPEVCLQLPSDSASQRTPLLFGYTLSTNIWASSGLSPVRLCSCRANIVSSSVSLILLTCLIWRLRSLNQTLTILTIYYIIIMCLTLLNVCLIINNMTVYYNISIVFYFLLFLLIIWYLKIITTYNISFLMSLIALFSYSDNNSSFEKQSAPIDLQEENLLDW